MNDYVIPLRSAVDQFRREPGAGGNAYDWYRREAQRSGRVSMGERRQFDGPPDNTIGAVKVRGAWMVDAAELQARLDEHRLARAERQQITEDFARNILHGEQGTTRRTQFGAYTIHRDFHVAYYDSVDRYAGNYPHWFCSKCWKPATTEHEKPECHTCSDWGGCGRDCTLSRVRCDDCGTALTV